MADNDNIILSVKNLSTAYFTKQGTQQAVRQVSFDINKGMIFALVGQSGCGKTSVAFSILRLIPSNQGKITGGNIFFDGVDLLSLGENKMRKVRGAQISLVFQQPAAAFNPVFTVGNQIAETIMLHQGKNKKQAFSDTVDLLKKVNIDQPEKVIHSYPHQLSGGMLQRIMIAMAVSCRPKLLIADEPTSSLDVTTEAGILDLLYRLCKEDNISILLITHNLGIVADRADYIAVMQQGQILEQGDTETILKNPSHSYTQSLINDAAKKLKL
jgi:ABC-type dipeptide/oligopeptide/nickel transport system ATPase component